jgi:hypothetical protein
VRMALSLFVEGVVGGDVEGDNGLDLPREGSSLKQ